MSNDIQENKSYINKWRKAGQISLQIVKWTFIALLVCGFAGGGAAAGYVASLVKDDPVRSRDVMMQKIQENSETGFVYFADDTLVGQLRSDEDRQMATLDEIPQVVKDATLAVEDTTFYQHIGIDFPALLRAVKQKLLHESVQTGASTITQQLARRVFLTLDREDSRKAKEIFLALRMERLMSKDEILLAYLNKIPYGNGSTGYNLYGIKAAAKGIFGIEDLDRLNIAEAAYLAGLPQQPSSFSCFTSKGEFDEDGFNRAVNRQKLVLKRMLEAGKINRQQYEEALAFDVKSQLAKPSEKAYNTYPYLMLEVEREVTNLMMKELHPELANNPKKDPAAYNEALKEVRDQMLHGGYRIYTTIDKTIYDSMREIAENDKNFSPNDPVKGMEQIGAVMVDNKTGAILGMMEGRDFFKGGQINHATQTLRQPGSTMKPIAAYLPALESGAIQPAGVIDDVPIILKDGQKGYHIPRNWDNKYHGLITAREALNESYNIPAIKLFLDKVGIKNAWDFARKLGITSLTESDNYAQTGVIGGLEYGVSVQELTGAYASIGNKGVFNPTYMIRKITDSSGHTIYEHQKAPVYAFSEQTAYLMTDMLRTVITSGTGTNIKNKFRHYKQIPVVGKTGSTQDDGDAWFMGFTPDITVGVWAGYDEYKYKLSKATGGTMRAMNIWSLIMDAAIDKEPERFPTKEFAKPDGIVEMTVSDLSGKLPSEMTIQTKHLVTDIFNKAYVPTEKDDTMVRMKVIPYDGIDYIPQEGTPSDMIVEKTVVKREKSMNQLKDELNEVLQKLPKEDRSPISSYMPGDADLDAPTQTDPRKDDGNPPKAPGGVALAYSGDGLKITFQPGADSDVVGYRFYRSVNRGPFQRVNGKVVLSGQDTVFYDKPTDFGIYGYYVTAVDVAGKESSPSRAVYSDGSVLEANMVPGMHDSGEDNRNPVSGAPSIPAGLTIKKKGAGIELSWKANPDSDKVKRYNIYYSEKANGEYKRLGSATNSTQFQYFALVYDGYYRISAVNDAGESKASEPVSFKK